MDKTDMSLLLLLLQNSRLPYAVLADKLNLSVNAIHKRIQQLKETGVISKFTAKVSVKASQAIVIFIFGTSKLENFQELPNTLRSHGSIYWLAIGSGKFLYIGIYIQNLSELEPLVSFLKKEAGLSEPTVGIFQPGFHPSPGGFKQEDMSLCGLDFKIINSLKDNARKPIVDIANEIGVSVKTVRRRLTRMIKNNLIELTIEWYPDKSDDIMTLLELRVQSDANIATVAYQIQKKYSTHTLFFYIYANISNTIMFVTWTNNMQELKRLRENIEKEFQVISAIPYVLTTGYIFETWRDQLAQKMLSISST